MALRRPLVLIAGNVSQLPAGDGVAASANISSVNQAADTSYVGAAFATIGAMSLSMTVALNSKLLILFSSAFQTSGAAEIDFDVRVDGVTVVAKRLQFWATHEAVDFSFLTAALSAGAHTVLVRWAPGGTTIFCRPVTFPARESATLILQEMPA